MSNAYKLSNMVSDFAIYAEYHSGDADYRQTREDMYINIIKTIYEMVKD